MKLSEAKQKTLDVLSTISGWGKNSVPLAILLWLCDFRAVRQGASIGKAYAENGIQVALKESSQMITRIVVWLCITFVLGFFAYMAPDSMAEKIFMPLFAISLVGVQLYIAIIYLVGGLAYQMFYSEKFTGGDYASGKKKMPIESLWDMTRYMMWWSFVFILLNLFCKPWLPDRFEWFIGLVLAEAAWVALGSRLIKLVRGAAITVTGTWGLVCALKIVFIVGVSYGGSVEARTRQIYGMGGEVIDTAVHAVDYCIDWTGNQIPATAKLKFPERIVDANEDGALNQMDISVIGRYANEYNGDSTAIRRWVSDGTRRYPLGDFDGNGVVDSADSSDFHMWLDTTTTGPGPATMDLRAGIIITAPEQSSAQQTKRATDQTTMPPASDPPAGINTAAIVQTSAGSHYSNPAIHAVARTRQPAYSSEHVNSIVNTPVPDGFIRLTGYDQPGIEVYAKYISTDSQYTTFEVMWRRSNPNVKAVVAISKGTRLGDCFGDVYNIVSTDGVVPYGKFRHFREGESELKSLVYFEPLKRKTGYVNLFVRGLRQNTAESTKIWI